MKNINDLYEGNPYMVDLNGFAEGSLAARFNEELQKVLTNIADPNTDPTKNRTITVDVKIHGDESRDIGNVSVVVKSKLLPAKQAETKLIMGADDNGNIIGQELKSGIKDQLFIDPDGDVATDTGEKIHVEAADPNRIISFKEQRS
ncbi:replication terminator protein [Pseudogracilibacillus auburnensis]|uniref:replication terminator protein n=1 Tax=Pseudogracilibacillus auburnensis TaxID=1494959 RepID=UPI001F61DC9A|nr:replication terminator protein [Pseudogracilibacillus auburnensis]